MDFIIVYVIPPVILVFEQTPTPISTFELPTDLLDDCSICLDQLLKGAKCKSLVCGHAFHDYCLKEEIVESCPNCRGPLKEN